MPDDLRADAPLSVRSKPERTTVAAPPSREKRRRRGGGVVRWLLAFVGVAVLGGGVAAFGFWRSLEAGLPDHRWLADYAPPQLSRIYAADSRLLAELAAERRVFVPIEAVPPLLQQAFISAEDQRFREHAGIDPLGIARALVTNAEQYGTGRRAVGASTITQQVAKNMLVGADRTVTRKVKEAILALRLEQALSKERILEIYLNEIFLGAQAYGVAAAAQAYFDKGLDQLTLGEMAFLAALPKAPNNYNPLRYPDAARARRDWVLDRMLDDAAITPRDNAAGKAEPIVPRLVRRPEVVAVGQHFTEEVRRELISRFGADAAVGGGLVVRTSLDPSLQAATEQALRSGLLAWDRRRGGWRGGLAKITAGPTEWLPALEALPRPPGLLPDWKPAVVLEVRATEARLGLLERPDPRGPAQPRNATLVLADLGWARRALDGGRLGPAPRRMADVVAVGDVIAVEEPRGSARAQLRQAPQVEGAIVALDPATGRVLAMAGGWSFERSQFNRATQAMRQPGSAFKPFVYLPALEQGIPPNQRFLDAPIEIATAQGIWRPSNYTEGRFYGAVTIRTALEKSLNLVTVRVAQEIGMDKVADAAQRFGIVDRMPRYLANALGSGETTVLRMAAGYGAFVHGGKRVVPSLIDSVQDARGRVIWRNDALTCRGCDAASPEAGPPDLGDSRPAVTSPIAAYQMVNILTGVVARGTGTRAGEGLNRPVAGKTGTTNDYLDNWFVGFTPDIVVAVWLGFDEPRSLGQGETGGQNAAPIFREVLAAALAGSPAVPFRAPPGVALVRTGLDGGGTIFEAFVPGTENSARGIDAGGGGETGGGGRDLGGLY